MQVDDLHLQQVFFKQFARKNQPPGLSAIGKLVENGLSELTSVCAENVLIKTDYDNHSFMILRRHYLLK